MTDVNQILELADKAATANDRWMFVAMFCVFILSILGAIRWMISDRKAMGDRLTQITDRHIEQGERLGLIVANNTTALNNTSQMMQICRFKIESSQKQP